VKGQRRLNVPAFSLQPKHLQPKLLQPYFKYFLTRLLYWCRSNARGRSDFRSKCDSCL